MEMMPSLQLERNNKKYDNINQMLHSMKDDGLSLDDIANFLKESYGFDEERIKNLFVSYRIT